MNLQTKEEVKYYIGKRNFFKKLLRTPPVFKYISGIHELTFQRNLGELTDSFFIAHYPEGILISDKKGKYRLGLSFSDLQSVNLSNQNHDLFELHITTLKSKSIIFSFQRKDLARVLPFVKLIPNLNETDPRDKHIARHEILKLRDEFAVDYFTDRIFCQPLNDTFSKHAILDINENRIKYKNREIDVASAWGYTVAIEELKYYGVSRFEYKVGIHHPEGHLFIDFTSASVFHKVGEHSHILELISRVLFDVISRPIVAKWLDKFADDEQIDYEDFSLSRHGMRLKSSGILIHWDEIVAQDNALFRWPYTNTVFHRIDSSYDHRGNMLFFLTKWLQEDTKRLLALMGRKYYVS